MKHYLIKLIAAVLVFGSCIYSAQASDKNLAEIRANVEILTKKNSLQYSLIITVKGSGDFIKLLADQEGLIVDFPLFSVRQKELEPIFRETCSKVGGSLLMPETSNGGRATIDCLLRGSTKDRAESTHEILKAVFEISDETGLSFEQGRF